MKTEYAAIYHTISSLIDISESEWEYYSALFEVRKFRKKQMLVQAGEVCRHIFFVNRGLLRVFFVDSEGEERTFHFTLTHDFSTDAEELSSRGTTTFDTNCAARIRKAPAINYTARCAFVLRFPRSIACNSNDLIISTSDSKPNNRLVVDSLV